jgi:hypothetical protein
MAIWLGASGCVAGVEEAPVCDTFYESTGDPSYLAQCGGCSDGETPEGYCPVDDGTAIMFVACGETWAGSCEDGIAITAGWPFILACSEETDQPVCEDAHCVTIPCDGEMHYGADHPDAP